MGEFVI